MADEFLTLSKTLQIPSCLRDVKITENDLELLATEAMKQTRLLPNNPREVLYDDALELYKSAL